MSGLDGMARLARTVRHLRGRQVAAQLLHAVRGVGSPIPWAGPAPERSSVSGLVPFPGAPEHARIVPGQAIRLIGAELDLSSGVDWGYRGAGPLFAYHLHQFDYLRRESVDPELRRALMLDWITRHPLGTGWDPHPTSLRILSWGKLLLQAGALPDDPAAAARIRHSLARQIETLSHRLEVRLQANHLLSNLIGVVFGGLLFDGRPAERWRSFHRQLEAEIQSQILPDGLHEERSPMYHALLLENLLDLMNLGRAVGSRAPRTLMDALTRTTPRMRTALETLCHPDGEIALFADSAFGIALHPARLAAYADELGVEVDRRVDARTLPGSGYVRVEAGPFTLIASVAGPAPAHMPGHAHCDALAFELSCGSDRVVTDTGVCEYVPGERRRISRSTAAHATLQLDAEEQSEVWGAHRVGGRAEVSLEAVEPGVRAVASCRGWSTPDTLHRRVFAARDGGLEIQDRVEGPAHAVVLRLPLAPGLEPRLSHENDGGTQAYIPLPTVGRLRIALPVAAHWQIERSDYYPRFGRIEERACLVGTADAFDSGTFRFDFVEG